MLARGHVVGCHSFAHDRLFALRGERTVREDLLRALASIEDATGKGTKLFRPPIGHTNPIIARVAEELGLLVVGFSVRALDGVRSARAESVARRVTSGLSDGAIVLMHDASEREDFTPAGPEALPPILEAMRARSLEGVTVPVLLA
jgi:peptidoglycan/xylan/chitin deacetylase (PgdA/CDA1 family)